MQFDDICAHQQCMYFIIHTACNYFVLWQYIYVQEIYRIKNFPLFLRKCKTVHVNQKESFHREVRLDKTSRDHLVQPGIKPMTLVLLAPHSNQLS